MPRPPLIAVMLVLSVLGGCATGGAPPPVPPPMAETVPLPPVSADPLRWRPGHWDWNGSGYVWIPGEYVPQSQAGTRWMPGYWSTSGGGAVWNPPHWVN